MSGRGGKRGRGRGRGGGRLRPPSPISKTLYALNREEPLSQKALDDAGLFPALRAGFEPKFQRPSLQDAEMLSSQRRLALQYRRRSSFLTEPERPVWPFRYKDRKRALEPALKEENKAGRETWMPSDDLLLDHAHGHHGSVSLSSSGHTATVPKAEAADTSQTGEGRNGETAEGKPAEDPTDAEALIDASFVAEAVLEEDDDYGREEAFDDDDDYQNDSGADEAVL